MSPETFFHQSANAAPPCWEEEHGFLDRLRESSRGSCHEETADNITDSTSTPCYTQRVYRGPVCTGSLRRLQLWTCKRVQMIYPNAQQATEATPCSQQEALGWKPAEGRRHLVCCVTMTLHTLKSTAFQTGTNTNKGAFCLWRLLKWMFACKLIRGRYTTNAAIFSEITYRGEERKTRLRYWFCWCWKWIRPQVDRKETPPRQSTSSRLSLRFHPAELQTVTQLSCSILTVRPSRSAHADTQTAGQHESHPPSPWIHAAGPTADLLRGAGWSCLGNPILSTWEESNDPGLNPSDTDIGLISAG